MKQMQCNALNITTTAKQVWLYFIGRTAWPGYAGTTMNVKIVVNTPKKSLPNPCLNQATQKHTCQTFLPKKSQNQKFQTQKNPLKSGDNLIT